MRGLPKFTDPDLIVGAETFSDAGVYRLRDDLYIVQTVDFFPPLIDDPFRFGQIAAANALSDVYAMGGQPKTALNIVGFPDKVLSLDLLQEILAGGAERVLAAHAVIVGGHSVRDHEIKYGLSVTGVVHPDQLLTNAAAQPGDLLVLTKPLGTGFVTTAGKSGNCPAEAMEAALASMMQLNQIGRDAALRTGVHAMTDVTGFGLAGHAGEMARASRVTLCLDVHRLPALPHAVELGQSGFKTRASQSNREFLEGEMRLEAGLDAARVELAFDAQTSGGLLIAVPSQHADQLVAWAANEGAAAACVIGEVVPQVANLSIVLRP